MVDEPHEVVKLLIKRMDSHPEEFRVGDDMYRDRWDEHISDIQAFGNAVDKAALDAKLRDIRLGEIHERVMDELSNGEERHRKKAEEQEYERNLAKSLQLTQQQAMQQQLQQYQNATGQYSQAQAVGLAGQSPNIVPVANGGTGAILPVSTINQIKQALGIKK
jgi:cysteine sulfinate desulfinase/cysteine desulfurase-like protein